MALYAAFFDVAHVVRPGAAGRMSAGALAIGIKLRAKQVPERVRDGKWTAIFGDAS